MEKLLKIDEKKPNFEEDIESRLRKKERKNGEIQRISSQMKREESNRNSFCSIKRRDFSKEFMDLQEKMKELSQYCRPLEEKQCRCSKCDKNIENHHKKH